MGHSSPRFSSLSVLLTTGVCISLFPQSSTELRETENEVNLRILSDLSGFFLIDLGQIRYFRNLTLSYLN